MDDQIVELMRAEDEAAGSGDLDRWLALFTEDAVYRYPGDNPLAGEYRGHDGLREWRRRRAEVAAKVRFDVQLHDVLGSADHGVQLYAVSAERGDRRASWRGAVVCHVRGGRIAEAWIIIDPMAQVDEFLTWAAAT